MWFLSQLLNATAAALQRQYKNKWGWPCSSQTLFTETGGRLASARPWVNTYIFAENEAQMGEMTRLDHVVVASAVKTIYLS